MTPSIVLQHIGFIFYGNSSTLFFNIVLWFLPCLFAAKMGFAVLTKYIKRTEPIALSLVFLSILGFLLEIFVPNIKLPFGLESAVTAIVFFGFGSLWKTRLYRSSFLKLTKILNKYSIPLLTFFGGLCFIIATISFNLYGQQVDTRLNHLNNYFLFYIAAFSGIIFCLIISKKLQKNFILEYIGRNTLVLFALHPILFFYFDQVSNFDIVQNFIGDTSSFDLSLAYTFFSVPLILFISKTSRSIRSLFALI
jgi:fucose 4-O-acetylase-like acetyltransferase